MQANSNESMREALEMMIALFDNRVICTSYANTPEEMEQIEELYRKVKAALAKPPRNCDMGTADEQAERYGRYCEKFTRDGMHCETCPCCGKIPFGKCEFAWAQMPYESEVSHGNA